MKGNKQEHKIIDNVEHKYCPKCDKWLILEDFATDKTRWDKKRDRCKECRKITRNNAQEKIFRKDPINILKKAEYDKKYLEKRNYKKEYQQQSLQRKISVTLRNRLNSAIKDNQRTGSAVRDLGCSIDEFKQYIEKQFYNNPETNEQMTWDNWGIGDNNWQLDHIIELRTVDFNDRVELLKAVHFTNIRPLWYCDHKKRGTRPTVNNSL